MPCCPLVGCYDTFRGYVNPPTIRQPCCCCVSACYKGKDVHDSYYINYLQDFEKQAREKAQEDAKQK